MSSDSTLPSQKKVVISVKNPKSPAKNLDFYSKIQPRSFGNSTPLIIPAAVTETAMIAGDIIPIYSSYRVLNSILISSWDGIVNLITSSAVFAVCILSFINQIVNNVAYQSYLVIVNSYQHVVDLPGYYHKLKNQFFGLFATITSSQGRDLWWLETKLEVRQAINKALKVLALVEKVTSKFYLAGLIFICLGMLTVSAIASGSGVETRSFLSTFINNNTYAVDAQVLGVSETKYQAYIAETQSASSTPVQRIFEIQVKEGDTLPKIADLYGLKVETIVFNNNLSSQDVTTGQKLYLPFADGYVYQVPNDMKPETIANIFQVQKEVLWSYNSELIDVGSGDIKTGAMVLVPRSDYAEVARLKQAEDDRRTNLAAAKNTNQNTIAKEPGVSSDKYINERSNNVNAAGFIWPAVGTISRCVQPGHIACDIANHNEPPVFSVRGGTVVKAGWDPTGYGNMVYVDHGNGVMTLYAHMKEIYVRHGQQVTQGQAVGQMGSTGYSTGTHLHFEVVIDGKKMNPLLYLP
jgi:murein DD-endopeptidase MepM/ murein hydrolase activator NlpD